MIIQQDTLLIQKQHKNIWDNIDEYLTITAKEPRLKFRVLNHSENNNEITLFINFNDNDDISQFFTLSGFKVDNTPKLQNPNSKYLVQMKKLIILIQVI
ncbi:hypothetical protein ONA02_04315 [Mycoplasmopsis felis]|uniref:hypothetical protein n=1 Tax=Mycoplasmopsis felis TaxID=33923 RepID=UPI0022860B8F|nr:hypothetical protein [Mycoplasmopsis felis]WAM01862.1 hypothetical protein ONA02_04315 [Mycoplasmopsis felis]